MRSLVRITTGIELGIVAVMLFIAIGFGAVVTLGSEGLPRLLMHGVIVVVSVGIILHVVSGIWGRYRRLMHGRCGDAYCHGNLVTSNEIPEHLVTCSTCRRVWPRLHSRAEAPAAMA